MSSIIQSSQEHSRHARSFSLHSVVRAFLRNWLWQLIIVACEGTYNNNWWSLAARTEGEAQQRHNWNYIFPHGRIWTKFYVNCVAGRKGDWIWDSSNLRVTGQSKRKTLW